MSGSQRKRVVFVGIDGGSWNLIEPMVEAGELPHLAEVLRDGAHGPLRSTIPVNSSVAWASFMTGVHAGKHGVFFFREQNPGSYHRPVVSFQSIKAPSIWKLASEHGKKVAVLYVPLTFPVEEVDGAMIGGLLTPDRSSDFIHPPELRAELEAAVGPVPSDNEPEKLFYSGDFDGAGRSLLEVTEQITKIAEHVLENHDPDIFAIVYRSVDLTCHQAWCYQDPDWAAKNPQEAAQRGHLVAQVYGVVDGCLGRIRDKVRAMRERGDDVVFACASDHGFGPITYRFYLNKWLVDNGYLVLKGSRTATRVRLFLGRKWHGLLRRTGVLRLLNAMGRYTPRSTETSIMELIDWSRTRAWSSLSGGEDIVLVNLKGREPQGVVEPGAEYEALRDEIVAKLRAVKTDDGTTVFPEVYKREELWDGPRTGRAPDIQCYTHESSINMAASPIHHCTSEPAEEGRPAMHRINGIYAFEGPGVVQPGRGEDGPQIADMAPTLLHLAGLPVEDYMDGRVLEEVLTPAYRESCPVQVREGHVDLSAAGEESSQLSAEDEAKLVETMQALGYME